MIAAPGIETPGPLRRLFGLAALIAAALVALLIQLAPLGAAPGAIPAPDLFWCVIAYFALRAPWAAPMAALFALALTRDFLVGGPVGASALTLLLAAEALKARAASPFPRGIWDDWLAASALFAAATAAQWLLMTVSFADPPPLWSLAPYVALTVGAFPLVAGVIRYGARLGGAPAAAAAGGAR